MDSLFFPLIQNESSLAPHANNSGKKSAGGTSVQETSHEGTFLDVLGGSQSAIDQNATLFHDLNDDSLLQLAAFTNQNNLDDTLPQASSLVDDSDLVLEQVDAVFTTNQVLVQIPVNPNSVQSLPVEILSTGLGEQISTRVSQPTVTYPSTVLSAGVEALSSVPGSASQRPTEAKSTFACYGISQFIE